jgi:hypothetical protein
VGGWLAVTGFTAQLTREKMRNNDKR